MKKVTFTIALSALLGSLSAWGDDTKAARAVIERFTQETPWPLELTISPEQESGKQYEVKVVDNKLHITGSSGVAICRGFYDFTKSQGWGISSWTGNRFDKSKAQQLPAGYSKNMKSPFKHHYYFNVVTYGYTMPYWDWQRWSEEIDWMALHGFDMPLALVAQEAIMTRVFKKIGIKDEDIKKYFAAPAHLPWMRMGNLFGIDGPLTDAWHKEQIALQHKVLKKMRSLGMKPICPGFAGFVPEGIKSVYPDTQLKKLTWASGAFHSFMMTPENPLFAEIGTLFIQEWEKEFGKNDYYIIDSFNEIDKPFEAGEDQFLNDYGKVIYKSIKDANPDATWVMQGWMLGYQPSIWTPHALDMLTKFVPDEKILILDLATDYNKHFWNRQYNWERYTGFFKKQWVYSTVPNMGGKVGQTGVLEFYANGVWDALNSPNKGNLVGFGTAPEGIENNEVIYELISDAGWQEKPINLNEWLVNYNVNRYGQNMPILDSFWKHMTMPKSPQSPHGSVYNTFTDHPRYNWQHGGGTINFSADYQKAIKFFTQASHSLQQSPLYRADLVELAALYAGGKAQQLINQINGDISAGKHDEAKKKIEQLKKLMTGTDDLLAHHPNLRLGKWLGYAKAYDKKIPKQGTSYESNARRLVTIWGPPINDYSARVWSGLIADYYLKRTVYYLENRMGAKHNIGDFERRWVAGQIPFTARKAKGNPVEMAKDLIAYADKVTGGGVKADFYLISSTTGAELAKNNQPLRLPVSIADIKNAKAIIITAKAPVKLKEASFILDGRKVPLKLDDNKGNSCRYSWSIPAEATANNECAIILQFDQPSEKQGQIQIRWIKN